MVEYLALGVFNLNMRLSFVLLLAMVTIASAQQGNLGPTINGGSGGGGTNIYYVTNVVPASINSVTVSNVPTGGNATASAVLTGLTNINFAFGIPIGATLTNVNGATNVFVNSVGIRGTIIGVLDPNNAGPQNVISTPLAYGNNATTNTGDLFVSGSIANTNGTLNIDSSGNIIAHSLSAVSSATLTNVVIDNATMADTTITSASGTLNINIGAGMLQGNFVNVSQVNASGAFNGPGTGLTSVPASATTNAPGFWLADPNQGGSGGSATNALIEGPAGIYDASLVTNIQATAIVGNLNGVNANQATNDPNGNPLASLLAVTNAAFGALSGAISNYYGLGTNVTANGSAATNLSYNLITNSVDVVGNYSVEEYEYSLLPLTNTILISGAGVSTANGTYAWSTFYGAYKNVTPGNDSEIVLNSGMWHLVSNGFDNYTNPAATFPNAWVTDTSPGPYGTNPPPSGIYLPWYGYALGPQAYQIFYPLGSQAQTYAGNTAALNANGIVNAQQFQLNGIPIQTIISSSQYPFLWVTNCSGPATNFQGEMFNTAQGFYTNANGACLIPPSYVGTSINGTNFTTPYALLCSNLASVLQGYQFYSNPSNVLGYYNVYPGIGNHFATNQPLVSLFNVGVLFGNAAALTNNMPMASLGPYSLPGSNAVAAMIVALGTGGGSTNSPTFIQTTNIANAAVLAGTNGITGNAYIPIGLDVTNGYMTNLPAGVYTTGASLLAIGTNGLGGGTGGGSANYSAVLSGTNVLVNSNGGITNSFFWQMTNNSIIDFTNFSVSAGAQLAKATIVILCTNNPPFTLTTTTNCVFGVDVTGWTVQSNLTYIAVIGPFPGGVAGSSNVVHAVSQVRGYPW